MMDEENSMMQEQQEGKPEQSAKREGAGRFFKGFLAGIAVMGLILGVGVNVFCRLTGNYLIFNGRGSNLIARNTVLDKATVDKVEELARYIDLYYYDDYDMQSVRDGIFEGEVSALGDVYSAYYTADAYADQQVSTNGTYYGIGAGLTQDTKTMQVTVSKIYEGTPSEEAGMKKDDVVLSVDGIDAASVELTELVKQIRGEEGTAVHIKVYRPSTEETLEFDVERRNVELPSVTGELLEDGIAYIQITEFQKNTAKQFEEITDNLRKEGMKSMILDVRSNPGGLLTTVVDILDDILPEGIVVYTKDKYGNREDYTSDASCMDEPIVVLIDQNSASAAEIFAGAIKDYNYGTLVGTTTFGKGIVQSLFPLSDGDALKITTAKYFTPEGNYIHEVGIEPDIELEYEFTGPEDGGYDIMYDNQIQKAIGILKEK